MIPQNDLRIGNFVNYVSPISILHSGTNPYDPIHVMDKYMFWYPIKELDPIPITEDWLIRLGFTKPNMWYKSADEELSIWIDGSGIYWSVWDDGHRKSIEYVHQLQNIYFALTGKELELKQNA